MAGILDVDWAGLFVPAVPLGEMLVRGTITYFVLLAVLRFFLKRQTGVIGIADLLVIVVIADAIQNAMAGEYKSITEGVVLLLTIVFWNYLVDWLGFHVPWVERLFREPPLLLVKDGRMVRRNMRQELITTEELMTQLRLQGCEEVAEVRRAYMEADGRISVIMHDPSPRNGRLERLPR